MARTKLYAAQAAERAGISRSTWLTYLKREQPLHNPVPPPDGRDIDGSHVRPWWYAETVDGWTAARPHTSAVPRPNRRARARR